MGPRKRALESLVIDPRFWRGKKVFLTGHTGFKGAWMSLVLHHLGAEIHGYALAPDDERDLFLTARLEQDVRHTVGDVRDFSALRSAVAKARPDVVVHMAAQALVRLSYAEPVQTYATNVMGTVHLLEAARQAPSVRAIVVVTSDKCYENVGWVWGYRETDRLGGYDPYSNSKGCCELVTAAYRNSFFSAQGCARVASARAGNVIGGGDWARDRLVPDAMRAFTAGEALRIRNPHSVRPWQHVLDPVLGYLLLAERLITQAVPLDEAWNFGPSSASEVPVGTIVNGLVRRWGEGARWEKDCSEQPHEAAYLKLDCSKAQAGLGWRALLDLDKTLQLTVDWYRAFAQGSDMRAVTLGQIASALEDSFIAPTIPA
jgi:CDP-glucose 4,6-dehydratase